jgi:hypothetical protein
LKFLYLGPKTVQIRIRELCIAGAGLFTFQNVAGAAPILHELIQFPLFLFLNKAAPAIFQMQIEQPQKNYNQNNYSASTFDVNGLHLKNSCCT